MEKGYPFQQMTLEQLNVHKQSKTKTPKMSQKTEKKIIELKSHSLYKIDSNSELFMDLNVKHKL